MGCACKTYIKPRDGCAPRPCEAMIQIVAGRIATQVMQNASDVCLYFELDITEPIGYSRFDNVTKRSWQNRRLKWLLNQHA